MTPGNFFGQTVVVSMLLGGLMQPVPAQELIPTEEVGNIMGKLFLSRKPPANSLPRRPTAWWSKTLSPSTALS